MPFKVHFAASNHFSQTYEFRQERVAYQQFNDKITFHRPTSCSAIDISQHSALGRYFDATFPTRNEFVRPNEQPLIGIHVTGW